MAVSLAAVLVALLLPSVAAMRESARKTQCANNLHQLGIAVHGYHDHHGALPPGICAINDARVLGPNPPCPALLPDRSLFVSLLPHLEQNALYASLNVDLSILLFENTTTHSAIVGVLVCPSDPDSAAPRAANLHRLIPVMPDKTSMVARASYAGNHGTSIAAAMPDPVFGCRVNPRLIDDDNGTFADVGPVSFASIRDGLAFTTLVTERATTPLHSLSEVDRPGDYSFEQTGWWFFGMIGETLTSSRLPPNLFRRHSVRAVGAEAWKDAASSMHPGGLNVLMADGSVRFVKDSIRTTPFSEDWIGGMAAPNDIWRAISTRDRGELVSGESFE